MLRANTRSDDVGGAAAGVTEADACRWLGRMVALIAFDGTATTGRLRHVSTRCAFVLHEEDGIEPFGGIIRAVPLAQIAEITLAERGGPGS